MMFQAYEEDPSEAAVIYNLKGNLGNICKI